MSLFTRCNFEDVQYLCTFLNFAHYDDEPNLLLFANVFGKGVPYANNGFTGCVISKQSFEEQTEKVVKCCQPKPLMILEQVHHS